MQRSVGDVGVGAGVEVMKMSRKMTANYKNVMRFIESYFVANCRAPSVREVVTGARLSSTSMAAYYLDKLATNGQLKKVGKGSRGFVPAWVPDVLQEAQIKNCAAM